MGRTCRGYTPVNRSRDVFYRDFAASCADVEANTFLGGADRYETYWLLLIAIRCARRCRGMMLEGSDQPLKTVAFDCGFGTACRFEDRPQHLCWRDPVQYRASFRRAEPA